MPTIRAVVFDLDGTLIDSRRDIAVAANVALETHGHRPLDESLIVSFVGDGAQQLIARCFGVAEESPDLDDYLSTFLHYYSAHPATHTTLLPGAGEMLDALSDLPLALCTNKPRTLTELVLDALGLGNRFAASFAGGDSPKRKPDPEPLLGLATTLGVAPSECVLVGDGPQDVWCGRAAGARVIGVEGMGSIETLKASRPDAIVPLAGVAPLIREWQTG